MIRTRRLGKRLTTIIQDVSPRRPDPYRPRRMKPGREPFPERLRDRRDPYAPHWEPDFEVDPLPDLSERPRILDWIHELPRPGIPDLTLVGPCDAQWNTLALFYNLDVPAAALPGDYAATDSQAVLDFLDEGNDPLAPGISEFLCRYWSTLSYGQLAFALATPRDEDGDPLIPTITPDDDDPQDWGDMIDKCLEQVAEAAWQAAGSLRKDSKRWIPSVVLVQNYWTHASATYGAVNRTFDGHDYIIGDRTHIHYSLDTSSPEGPTKVGRKWWGTLCHEFAHNFLEFGDLYGPQGCTGYWDLLGDNTPPGRMSEVCSAIKKRVGWLDYKEVIDGPTVPSRSLSLQPYTTTGEAYKVVPDPEHTPHEYFLLEFRKSTGDEVWRPDGALPEAGLLVIHINDRLGIPSTWLLREAPFFDPEFADDPVPGYVDWTGHDDLAGKVFPQAGKTSFTPSTTPTSRLYGGRDSGLHITDISVSGDTCRFTLRIAGNPRVRWTVSDRDRAVAGRFTPDSPTGGEEIFLRDDDNAALLVHRQAQWLVNRVHHDWIGGWNLGRDNRELVGDLDGDGLDEIYIRSPNWAGLLEYRQGAFRSVTVQHDWIDEWNLGEDNWEHIADLDGDGRAEIYIRSPNWAGVMRLVDGRLRLVRLHHDWIDGWNLALDNTELVGRFASDSRDEIAIRSPEWLGLFRWRDSLARLELIRIQHDWVDGWNMGGGDWHVVGDFDGDGLDEIFIRSNRWAGVMKWQAGRFRTVWMTKDTIDNVNGKPEHGWDLAAGQRIYSGRFRNDRDGVLIRDDGWGVAVLAWDDGAMKVHKRLKSSFNNRWNLGPGDHFVLGDFHRLGTDVADVLNNPVIDGLTDVFMHSEWGTGMIGVNHGQWNPSKPDNILDQMGLTWIQQGKLMDED